MSRASKLMKQLSEKGQSKEFWVNKSDAKEALQIMKRLGFRSDEIKISGQKIKGMTVWTITADTFVLQNTQQELANKNINSWLEGERNE